MIFRFIFLASLIFNSFAAVKYDGVLYDTNTATVVQQGLRLTNFNTAIFTNGVYGKDIINVKDPRYNAKGDGSTIDTAALQLAFDDAHSKGIPVYIPPVLTYYKIDAQLNGYDNLVIFGDGFGSKIQTISTNNVIKFTSKTNFVVSKVHLRTSGSGFTTSVNYDTAFSSICLLDCKDGVIDSCYLTGYQYLGVMAYRSDRTIVQNCKFIDPGYVDPYAFQSQVTDIQFLASKGCIARNNFCYSLGANPGDNGIAIFGGSPELNSEDNIIINNRISRKTQYGVLSYSFSNPLGVVRTVNDNNYVDNIDGSYHHIAEGTLYTGITFGTAAGTAFYMQTSLESKLSNNKIFNCGKFTRANGTHARGAIGNGGCPDLQATANLIVSNYFMGINMNNSGLSGDYTNRSVNISGNTLIDNAGFINFGSINAGSTQLTLVDMTMPLASVETNRAMGGFWAGDKIVLKQAGAAATDFEGEIFSITNGIVNLVAPVVSTVVNKGVILSELSGTPPSTRHSLAVVICDRPSIVGNTITKNAYMDSFVRSGGVFIQGTSGGVPMITPLIQGNQIKGGYNGIVLSKVNAANVNGNTVGSCTIDGILANDNDTAILLVGNTVYNSGIGIVIVSSGGHVVANSIRSCPTGITSTSAELALNTFLGVTTPYGNETPFFDVSGVTNTITKGISFANSFLATNSITANNLATNGVLATWNNTKQLISISPSGGLTQDGTTLGGPNWNAVGTTNSSLVGGATVDNITQTNGLNNAGKVNYSGVISPGQITSNQNDYNPTGFANCNSIRVSTDISRNITGFVGQGDGNVKYLMNIGSTDIVFKNEDAASIATNRFSSGSDITLVAGHGITFRYDLTSTRWRPVSGETSPPPASNLFVTEQDGTPNVSAVVQIKFTNGTVTDNGAGSVSVNNGSGSGDSVTVNGNAATDANLLDNTDIIFQLDAAPTPDNIVAHLASGYHGTNGVLITPTIASFINANHNHQNAAGGGTLDVAAVTTGIWPDNRLALNTSLSVTTTNTAEKGILTANGVTVTNILQVGNDITGATPSKIKLEHSRLEFSDNHNGGNIVSDSLSTAEKANQTFIELIAQTGTTDDLSTIVNDGGDSQFIILTATSGHTVTVKHNVGNIICSPALDFTITSSERAIGMYDALATKWYISKLGGWRSENLGVFAPTSSAQLAGVISDETGTDKLVYNTSPTLVTPVLGSATATTINKVTITQPTTSATLTIADGKSLIANENLTVTQPVVLNRQSSTGLPVEFCIAMSDETTAIAVLSGAVTWRAPYAFTITDTRASVNTVSSSGLPTVNIRKNGTTIYSTKLTIDASELTSVTAATPYVLSVTSVADDDEIKMDIDGAGTGAKGLKVWIKGYR